MKILTLVKILLIVSFSTALSSAFAQQDKLTINTFYPLPHLTYKDLTTKEFDSYQTDVTRTFNKNVTGSTVPNPIVSRDSIDEAKFPSLEYGSFVNHNSIYFTLFDQPLRVKPPTSLSTSDFGALRVNGIENLTRFNTMTEWPAPTGCISTTQFYIGLYGINCGSTGFLADISETPGFYIAIGAGGGNAHLGLGAGGGFKMGFVNYTCCQIAGLSGGGWIPPGDTVRCHDQYMILQTKTTELRGLLDELYNIVDDMQAHGCCYSQGVCTLLQLIFGGSNHDAVNSGGNERHCCLPPIHWPICTDLANQYNAKNNEVNAKRAELNAAKNDLCTCMCEGDADCLNNCITP